MLDIFYTSKFKKGYKKMLKQGKKIAELTQSTEIMAKMGTMRGSESVILRRTGF